jgi:hypothetical protein
MMFVNHLQLYSGVVSGLIVAAAWWYVAIRLSYHWVLYALAIVATVAAVLFLAFALLTLTPQPMRSYPVMHLLSLLGILRVGISLVNAALYIIFAGWITSRAGQTSNQP